MVSASRYLDLYLYLDRCYLSLTTSQYAVVPSLLVYISCCLSHALPLVLYSTKLARPVERNLFVAARGKKRRTPFGQNRAARRGPSFFWVLEGRLALFLGVHF